MQTKPMPMGDIVYSERPTVEYHIKNTLGFYEVEVKTPRIPVLLLPFRLGGKMMVPSGTYVG